MRALKNPRLTAGQELERVKHEYQSTIQTIERQLKRALAEAGEMRVSCRMTSDERTVRITAKNEAISPGQAGAARAGTHGRRRRVEASGGRAQTGGGRGL